jgi:hypothetical protein
MHMENKTTHLADGERGRLETKVEAGKARDKMERVIRREIKVSVGEMAQKIGEQQKVQVEKLGEELKREQKTRFIQVLQEVKRARRDIRNQ